MIPQELYKQIVDALPILCVDIAIKNKEGKYLLVKRANEPLKGEWWVIGGRVKKGEKLAQAAARKIKEEVGLTVSEEKLNCLGYYEDFFEKNPLNVKILHTLGILFGVELNGDLSVKLDNQSHEWQFFDKLPERLQVKPFAGL